MTERGRLARNFRVRATKRYGTIANARAGNPSPSLTFGHVTTMIAPVAGT